MAARSLTRRSQFKPWSAARSYAAAVLADAPVGYWKLDEATGTAAADSSGGGRTGTIVNTPVLGAAGVFPGERAITFAAASSQQVSVASLPTTVIDNYAIECWVKLTALPTASVLFLMNGDDGAPNGGWGVGAGTANAVDGFFGGVSQFSSTHTFTTLGWHHIVMTREAGTDKFYVNGVLYGAAATPAPKAPVGGLAIGCQPRAGSTPYRFVSATMNHLAVYNIALTAAKVSAHYNALAVPGSPYATAVIADAPASYWKLDQPTGSYVDQRPANIPGAPAGTVTRNVFGGADGGWGAGLHAQGSIAFGNNYGFAGVGAFSVEMWVKRTGDSTGYAKVFNKNGTAAGTSGWGWQQNAASDVTPGALTVSRTSTTAGQTLGTAILTLNQWYHVVQTYDGTTMKLYVDGVQVGSVASPESITDSANALTLGGPTGVAAGEWPGQADELAIYTTALPAARILAHYNAR